jgi:hypothetical protein
MKGVAISESCRFSQEEGFAASAVIEVDSGLDSAVSQLTPRIFRQSIRAEVHRGSPQGLVPR